MNEERKTEEFETETKKWRIYFDMVDLSERHSCIDVRFSKSNPPMTSEDVEELKQDLKDLGKLRIIKQGKRFLE